MGLSFDAFMEDSKTVDAVERNFEIIGEAANQLPVNFQSEYSHIEWHHIVSFRNRLIHGYFGVDYRILWFILKNDLSNLGSQLLAGVRKFAGC
jgi:uncharacterized protein with HEPN domain